jgi:hypothetical protein
MNHRSSIEQDALFFVFPLSCFRLGGDLTLDDINTKVEALEGRLFKNLQITA